MEIYTPPAGLLLRDFRERMDMTLREAATLLSQAPSTLSRKERGEKPVERDDVRNAIDAYELTTWEADELWLAAGFLPERSIPFPTPAAAQHLANELMSDVAFPACVTDPLGYIYAWNPRFDALWLLSQQAAETAHIVDLLFSPQASALLGAQWQDYVQRELYLLYCRTLKWARTPEFRSLLYSLREQHGEPFLQLWDDIHRYQYLVAQQSSGAQTCRISVHHEHAEAAIDYVCVRSHHEPLIEYELMIYMPVGADDLVRFTQWWNQQMDSQRYFSKAGAVAACSNVQ